MDSMSAKSIGVDGIQVTGSDSTNADKAVDTISDAIITAFSSDCSTPLPL